MLNSIIKKNFNRNLKVEFYCYHLHIKVKEGINYQDDPKCLKLLLKYFQAKAKVVEELIYSYTFVTYNQLLKYRNL